MQIGFSLDCPSGRGDIPQRPVHRHRILKGLGVAFLQLLPDGIAMVGAANTGTGRQVTPRIIFVEPVDELAPGKALLNQRETIDNPLIPAGLLPSYLVSADPQPHLSIITLGCATPIRNLHTTPYLLMDRIQLVVGGALAGRNAYTAVLVDQKCRYIQKFLAFRVSSVQDIILNVAGTDSDNFKGKLRLQPIEMGINFRRLPAGIGENGEVRLGKTVISSLSHQRQTSRLNTGSKAQNAGGIAVP